MKKLVNFYDIFDDLMLPFTWSRRSLSKCRLLDHILCEPLVEALFWLGGTFILGGWGWVGVYWKLGYSRKNPNRRGWGYEIPKSIKEIACRAYFRKILGGFNLHQPFWSRCPFVQQSCPFIAAKSPFPRIFQFNSFILAKKGGLNQK